MMSHNSKFFSLFLLSAFLNVAGQSPVFAAVAKKSINDQAFDPKTVTIKVTVVGEGDLTPIAPKIVAPKTSTVPVIKNPVSPPPSPTGKSVFTAAQPVAPSVAAAPAKAKPTSVIKEATKPLASLPKPEESKSSVPPSPQTLPQTKKDAALSQQQIIVPQREVALQKNGNNNVLVTAESVSKKSGDAIILSSGERYMPVNALYKDAIKEALVEIKNSDELKQFALQMQHTEADIRQKDKMVRTKAEKLKKQAGIAATEKRISEEKAQLEAKNKEAELRKIKEEQERIRALEEKKKAQEQEEAAKIKIATQKKIAEDKAAQIKAEELEKQARIAAEKKVSEEKAQIEAKNKEAELRKIKEEQERIRALEEKKKAQEQEEAVKIKIAAQKKIAEDKAAQIKAEELEKQARIAAEKKVSEEKAQIEAKNKEAELLRKVKEKKKEEQVKFQVVDEGKKIQELVKQKGVSPQTVERENLRKKEEIKQLWLQLQRTEVEKQVQKIREEKAPLTTTSTPPLTSISADSQSTKSSSEPVVIVNN